MQTFPDHIVAKGDLRRRMLERLAAVDAATAGRAARAVTERALALPEIAGARDLLVCLSFASEIDTWPLVARLVKSGRRVYVPRATGSPAERKRLTIHPYPCELETLPFGLRQPAAGEPVLDADAVDATLEVALVAGLAFDRRGYRLGYGQGYFDRFLAGRPFAAFGVAYDDQVLDAVPVEPHDVPLAGVLTETRVLRAETGSRRRA